MAPESVSSASESSSVPVSQNSSHVELITVTGVGPRKIDDEKTGHHVQSSGDDNAVHLNDAVARSLRLPGKARLSGRVLHGKLVQENGIDLLRREEMKLRPEIVPLIRREIWDYFFAALPGEEIYIRYSRPANLRLNRPITFKVTIYVLRDGIEHVIQMGEITVIPATIGET